MGEQWIVRYRAPVYVFVDTEERKVTKVIVGDEELMLDVDRLNHEHPTEVVMDPEVMDIPGPFEVAYEKGDDGAWDEAQKIVDIAEDHTVEWPAWQFGW